ncbi:LLM class flavin-dependent oxidoreductase [Nocardia brevicatena]|uniref:LLM class flavin-dependent oxidoreductase n=1 Tax=Nocardia brevicatena TaxID=37327 RepID=UPI000319EDA7|nr:LLM class flavin-dependent oxidoreductase [Nocardia brevicatena]
MSVGIGLPVSDPAVLLEWARRAEHGPFDTIAILDRLVYDNPEPMIGLAAIAAATTRIRLQTEVVLAPLRETALLAKQSATLDRISNGRFTLGVGVGGRADDYLATGVDIHTRGKRLDTQLDRMRSLWAGAPFSDEAGPIGPRPTRTGGPELLIGGFAQAALARVARWADGFLGAGLPPAYMDAKFRAVERAWAEAGRAGSPRLVAQVNVAIGPDEVVAEALRELRRYYAFSDYVDGIASGMSSSAESVRQAMTTYTDIGADEVIFYCWSADPDQVDRLADIVDATARR